MAQIDGYLKYIVSVGASDLHLSGGTRPMLRLHGTIRPVSESDPGLLSAEAMDHLLAEIIPERAKQELESRADTDFAYAVPGLGRFRVNAFRNSHGTGVVLRHIPSKIMTFEDLQLPEILSQFCLLKKGLVLVTGPTGSGKSTTLAAMIDYINRHRREHIITIEDPIEFVHENKNCRITQREVKEHTESFRSALRAALRQDPDIVLVGEMRDLETTEIAIETAETGHLVFGTLHTTTAASTVDRVIDQFPHERQEQIRAMLSSSLAGVVSQTLCRRASGTGRVAALEILVVNHGVSGNIRSGKTHQIPTSIQVGRAQGMNLLNDDLLRLVEERTIEPMEAYLQTVEKTDMVTRLRSRGFPTDGMT